MRRVNEDSMQVMYPRYSEVLAFAKKAHQGQIRSLSGAPYIVHPIEVASLLVHSFPDATEEMVYAAILHDVVEDTEYTLDDIRALFGAVVAELVYWLTSPSTLSDGNRSVRKAIDRAHFEKAPHQAQILRMADVMSNTRDIHLAEVKYGKRYLNEKRMVLDAAREDVKSTPIWRNAEAIILGSHRRLNEIALVA